MKLEKYLINLVSMMVAMQGMALIVNGQWIEDGWTSLAIMAGLAMLFSAMQWFCEQMIK